jgi:hypothetical protein
MIAGALVLVGCITYQQPSESDKEGTLVGQTGLALGVAVNMDSDTDVGSIEYRIERIACFEGEEFEELTLTARESVQPTELPPEFEGSPLDDNSKHPFADHFEVVPAGCYDILATPLTSGGAVSEDCAMALANGIEVVDGETTEVFMISQCKGKAVGAVDTVVAFNRPPNLIDLTYSPSKFITEDTTVTICATAMDPNGDPIQFEWSLEDGGACTGPDVSSSVQDHETITTECIAVTPNETGGYWFLVQMWDLITNEEGTVVRIEDWLAEHGYPNESHDSLRFPLYVSAARAEPEPEPQE